MKMTLATLCIATALAFPVIVNAEQSPADPAATQKRLEEIHQHLMSMEATINKMEAASSEAERKRLLTEHSAMMDKGMTLLGEVHVMDQVQRRGCTFHQKQNPTMTCKVPQTTQGAEIDLMQMLMRMMYQQRVYDITVSKGLEH
jgi:hypothetical protein